MICEVMAAEVTELCGPKHPPNNSGNVRAGSSSGRVIAYDQREDIVRPRVRREDESGQQEEVKLGEKPHKFWGRIQAVFEGQNFMQRLTR